MRPLGYGLTVCNLELIRVKVSGFPDQRLHVIMLSFYYVKFQAANGAVNPGTRSPSHPGHRAQGIPGAARGPLGHGVTVLPMDTRTP